MSTQRTLTPEEIVARGGGEPTFLRLPDPGRLFKLRAARLAQLAPAAAMGEYLALVGRIAAAQGPLLNDYPGEPPLPGAAALEAAERHKMPPLAVQSWLRDSSWRAVLRAIVARIAEGGANGEPVRAVLEQLARASDDWLEDQAHRLLNEREVGLDRAAAVFIGAALQVYWTAMTSRLGPAAFRPLDVPGVCPCCGSRPVSSILRPGIGGMNRYLVCSLCAAEWNHPRIQCPTCGNDKDIEYLHVEEVGAAIKAEACPECDTYGKVFYTDKDAHLEPVADDLASLALDMVIGDTTSYLRAGVNLAFFPGDEGGPAQPADDP